MHMRKYRVTFYGPTDLSCLKNLELAEKVLDDYIEDYFYDDINDIIEFYNITLFFKANLFHPTWSSERITKYKTTYKSIQKRINIFLFGINDTNLSSYYDLVDVLYKTYFWSLFEAYKVYSRISEQAFDTFITNNPHIINFVLKHKNLVNFYGVILTKQLSHYNDAAELILNGYALKKGENDHRLFFPSDLTFQTIEKILYDYIDSESPNPNYLKIIFTIKTIDNNSLNDRIRLRAKQRYDAVSKKILENSSSLKFYFNVSICDQADPICHDFTEDGTYNFSYSRKWLENNLEYETILNNFIFLFGYTDLKFRCSFISTSNKIDTFEQLIGLHCKSEYSTGIIYNAENILASAQIKMYYNFLQSHNIKLENVFKWFFETYLQREFGVIGYKYIVPTDGTSFYEKILVITAQLESVLKQFRLYVDDGFISRELHEFSSNAYRISDTPSMLDAKYAYISSSDLKNELFHLYSNQSMLSYTDRTKSKYDTFIELISRENILKTEIPEYNWPVIDYLINRNTLFLSSEGFIKANSLRESLLYELYRHDVIACSYLGKAKQIFEDMLEHRELVVESTLFSRQEQEYLDYLLNVQKFENGPEIRNKYAHGTNSLDPVTQEREYFELLKIMVLVIIKINEEFCLKFPNIV